MTSMNTDISTLRHQSSRDMVVVIRDWLEEVNSSPQPDDVIRIAMDHIAENLTSHDEIDVSLRQRNIFQLLVAREYGLSPPFAHKYLTDCLSVSSKVKPLVYMALSLFESPDTTYSSDTLHVVLEDLEERSMCTLQWLACTSCTFDSTILCHIGSFLKNIVFRSVAATALVNRASAALLNLCRTHKNEVSFTDVLPRLEVLLSRDDISHTLYSNLLGMCVTMSESECEEKEVIASAVMTQFQRLTSAVHTGTHDDQFSAALLVQKCLQFFRSFSYKVMKKDERFYSSKNIGAQYAVPTWWSSLQTVLKSVLVRADNLDSTVASHLKTSDQSETRQLFSSKLLMTSLQLSTVLFLIRIYTQQLLLKLNSISPVSNMLNTTSVENGIVFGSLFQESIKCILRLIKHTDVHVKTCALRCGYHLAYIVRTVNKSKSQCCQHVPSEVDHFILRLVGPVDDILLAVANEIKEGKLENCDTVREAITHIVLYSSEELCFRIQNLMLEMVSTSKSTAKTLLDEIARGLVLLSQRLYIVSMWTIGSVMPDSYTAVVQELDDGTPFQLIEIGNETQWPQQSACCGLDDVMPHWLMNRKKPSSSEFPIFPRIHLGLTNSTPKIPTESSSLIRGDVSAPDGVAMATLESTIESSHVSEWHSSHLNLERKENLSPTHATSPPSSTLLGTLSLKRLTSGSSYSATQQFRRESVSFNVQEKFTAKCNAKGSIESTSVNGTVLMSSKVNQRTSIEVGLNINHPDIFRQIDKRLRPSETVIADRVIMNDECVRKVDARGSIYVLAEPGGQEDVTVMEYTIANSPSPLTTQCYASCAYDNSNPNLCSIRYKIHILNTSSDLNIFDMVLTVPVPSFTTAESFHYDCSKHGARVKSTFFPLEKNVIIKLKKIKAKMDSVVTFVLKATGVEYNRFGALDQIIKRIDIEDEAYSPQMYDEISVQFYLRPLKNTSPYASSLSTLSLRYVKFLGQRVNIATKIRFLLSVDWYTSSVEEADVDDTRIVKPKYGILGFLKSHKCSEIDNKSRKHESRVRTCATETKHPERDLSRQGSTESAGGGIFVDVGNRNWEWERDAKLLEDLESDDGIDIDAIQARCARAFGPDAVYTAIERSYSRSDSKYGVNGELFESRLIFSDTFDSVYEKDGATNLNEA